MPEVERKKKIRLLKMEIKCVFPDVSKGVYGTGSGLTT